MASYLLDTNALLFLFASDRPQKAGLEMLPAAAAAGQVLLSPVSGWELGSLATRPSGALYGFMDDPAAWVETLIHRAGLVEVPLTLEAAILASRLPGEFHKDPADRLLVASAIVARATFVTRDDRIINWARQTGALSTLTC